MLNTRYTVIKDFPEFHKRYQELVVGSSFKVIRVSAGYICDGIMGIKMDSGTVYDIALDPDYWCFYTENMVVNYLEAQPMDDWQLWKFEEDLILKQLELHRSKEPKNGHEHVE
ncbi:hypothetical protein HPMBJEAJ_00052 [Aeromonas phage avDM6]|nr:hypothetical protein HPMBJEAJ_00052 [Aeromonas phage avDM6]